MAIDVVVTDSRPSEVGSLTVRRALPLRGRRTVGAWCFADHMGPVTVTEDEGVDIGPHPHTGLQTVTWLVAGEILHLDSLGSEQPIRPGQLNLMTAGHGVSHAEERSGGYRGELHGAQLWIAQPEATRHGDAAFEHHAELPQVDLGTGVATVLVGELADTLSSARRDTEHVGAELALRPGRAVVPLHRPWEYALVVLTGAVTVGTTRVEPGHLGYLGTDHEECPLISDTESTVLLIGGELFAEPIRMWWNFVARTRDELTTAREQWMSEDDRFGTVRSLAAADPRRPAALGAAPLAAYGAAMELLDALRANPSVRDFTDERVSDAEVAAILDDARFAPSGGNRQPWRVAVIEDMSLRRSLADLCGPVWSEYVALGATGATPFAVAGPQPVVDDIGPQPNPLLDAIEQVPVVLVVAADLTAIAMMDKDLGRPTLTGGASVYPFVHSILLAARGRGLGGVMTTFLARAEEAARPLLGLPDDWAVASMVCLGHPVRRTTKLSRRPMRELAFVDRFDGPAFGP